MKLYNENSLKMCYWSNI